MRRLARHLFTLCSVVSLLLFLAVCVLWVRSLWVADFGSQRVLKPIGFREVGLQSSHGSVHLAYLRTLGSLPASEPTGFIYESHDASRVRVLRDTPARKRGFGYERRAAAFAGMIQWTIWAPHWLLALATVALPVLSMTLSVRSKRRRHRLTLGLCPSCGYDLRASAGRCPECGTRSAPKEGA